MTREGRAIFYITAMLWFLLGFWEAAIFYSIFITAAGGDESFEAEDIPLTEKLAYQLPDFDLELGSMEDYFFYYRTTEEGFKDKMNF